MNRPDPARPARILRWLAAELEAGRAVVELDVHVDREAVERPRSMFEDPNAPIEHDVVSRGTRIRVAATTITEPPNAPPCRALFQHAGEHTRRICTRDKGHNGDHGDGSIAPRDRHERSDHDGDGPCAACQPARPHVLEDGKLRAAVGAEEHEIALVFDQVGHVIKSRFGVTCADTCAPACRAGGRR